GEDGLRSRGKVEDAAPVSRQLEIIEVEKAATAQLERAHRGRLVGAGQPRPHRAGGGGEPEPALRRGIEAEAPGAHSQPSQLLAVARVPDFQETALEAGQARAVVGQRLRLPILRPGREWAKAAGRGEDEREGKTDPRIVARGCGGKAGTRDRAALGRPGEVP